MDLYRRLMRWLFMIGSVGLSLILIKRGLGLGGGPASFIPILGAMLLLVISAVLIAPDLVRLFAKPLFALVDSIFFPGGRSRKPVLSYTLPNFYTREKRYQEALDEYLKILRHYPREGLAYLGAIELLVVEFGDESEARDLYTRARRKLRASPEDLAAVEARWLKLGIR